MCSRYEGLNTLLTIYTVTICLEQRVTSPDEEEVHVDRYLLQTWECSEDKAKSHGYLWRGMEAKQIAGDDLEQGYSGSRSEDLHLNGGPRLPSSVLGGCSTTGAVLRPIVSSVSHQLILETTYTTYAKDDGGVWVESPKSHLQRQTQH